MASSVLAKSKPLAHLDLKCSTYALRDHSQLMSVGHFDFTPHPHSPTRTKVSARKRYQNGNVRSFFENLKTPYPGQNVRSDINCKWSLRYEELVGLIPALAQEWCLIPEVLDSVAVQFHGQIGAGRILLGCFPMQHRFGTPATTMVTPRS